MRKAYAFTAFSHQGKQIILVVCLDTPTPLKLCLQSLSKLIKSIAEPSLTASLTHQIFLSLAVIHTDCRAHPQRDFLTKSAFSTFYRFVISALGWYPTCNSFPIQSTSKKASGQYQLPALQQQQHGPRHGVAALKPIPCSGQTLQDRGFKSTW
jgi:hypothetical protein